MNEESVAGNVNLQMKQQSHFLHMRATGSFGLDLGLESETKTKQKTLSMSHFGGDLFTPVIPTTAICYPIAELWIYKNYGKSRTWKYFHVSISPTKFLMAN